MAKITIVYDKLKERLDEIFEKKLQYEPYIKTKEAIRENLMFLMKHRLKDKQIKRELKIRFLAGDNFVVPSPEDIDNVINDERLDERDRKFLEFFKKNFASDTAYTTYMRIMNNKGEITKIRMVMGFSTNLIKTLTNGTYDLTEERARQKFEAVIFHEAMHQIWGHLDMRLSMNPILANILEDLVINSEGLKIFNEGFEKLKNDFGGIFPDTFKNIIDSEGFEKMNNTYNKVKDVIDELINYEMSQWYERVKYIIQNNLKDNELLNNIENLYEKYLGSKSDNKLKGLFEFFNELNRLYSENKANGLLSNIERIIYTMDKVIKKLSEFNKDINDGEFKGIKEKDKPIEGGNIGEEHNGILDENDIDKDVLENEDIFKREEDETKLNGDLLEANINTETHIKDKMKDIDENWEKEHKYRVYGELGELTKFKVVDSLDKIVDSATSKIIPHIGDGMEYKWVDILHGYKRKIVRIGLKQSRSVPVVERIEIPIVKSFLFTMVDTSGSINEFELSLINSMICSTIRTKLIPTVLTNWDFNYQGSIFINPLEHFDIEEQYMRYSELHKDIDNKVSNFIDDIKEKLSVAKGRGGTGNFQYYLGTIYGIKNYINNDFQKDLECFLKQVDIDNLNKFYNDFVDKGKVNTILFTDSDFTFVMKDYKDFIEKFDSILSEGNKLFICTVDNNLIDNFNEFKNKFKNNKNIHLLDLRPYVKRLKELSK